MADLAEKSVTHRRKLVLEKQSIAALRKMGKNAHSAQMAEKQLPGRTGAPINKILTNVYGLNTSRGSQKQLYRYDIAIEGIPISGGTKVNFSQGSGHESRAGGRSLSMPSLATWCQVAKSAVFITCQVAKPSFPKLGMAVLIKAAKLPSPKLPSWHENLAFQSLSRKLGTKYLVSWCQAGLFRVTVVRVSSQVEKKGRTRPANQRARDARKKKRETRTTQRARQLSWLTRTRLSLLLSCVPRSLIGWSCAPLLFHLTRNSNYGDSEQPWCQVAKPKIVLGKVPSL
ncbi:hypothetical protein DdX_00067 [Ditylenchus destructor]|uniref:Uncharacterized protein n=1 Tax=Ditylenchus destructor TaxID=166010 RepID=A0AAD4RD09_9BILA|nr:hypothetical protein DdX_00067 [Ditylenchus destructor]